MTARAWLHLNGHLTAVFAYAANLNEPWSLRGVYKTSLADAEFIVFVDCSGPEPRFLVVPASRYGEIDSRDDWDEAHWVDRWDLVPA